MPKLQSPDPDTHVEDRIDPISAFTVVSVGDTRAVITFRADSQLEEMALGLVYSPATPWQKPAELYRWALEFGIKYAAETLRVRSVTNTARMRDAAMAILRPEAEAKQLAELMTMMDGQMSALTHEGDTAALRDKYEALREKFAAMDDRRTRTKLLKALDRWKPKPAAK